MRLSGITDQRMLWGVVADDHAELVHLRIVGGMRWPDQHAVAMLSREEARAIGAALLEAAGAGLEGFTHVQPNKITIEGCDPDAFVRGLAEVAARASSKPHPGTPPSLTEMSPGWRDPLAAPGEAGHVDLQEPLDLYGAGDGSPVEMVGLVDPKPSIEREVIVLRHPSPEFPTRSDLAKERKRLLAEGSRIVHEEGSPALGWSKDTFERELKP